MKREQEFSNLDHFKLQKNRRASASARVRILLGNFRKKGGAGTLLGAYFERLGIHLNEQIQQFDLGCRFFCAGFNGIRFNLWFTHFLKNRN